MNRLLGKMTWILTLAAVALYVLAVWPNQKPQETHLTTQDHPDLVDVLQRSEVQPLLRVRSDAAGAVPAQRKQGGDVDRRPTLADIRPPVATLTVGQPVAVYAPSAVSKTGPSSVENKFGQEASATPTNLERQHQAVESHTSRALPRQHYRARLVQHEKPNPQRPKGVWPEASELYARLDVLSSDLFTPSVQQWAGEIRLLLDKLHRTRIVDFATTNLVLSSLHDLANRSLPILTKLEDERRTHVVRAKYALIRRISVWRAVMEKARDNKQPLPPIQAGAADVMGQIASLNARFRNDELRRSWQNFLGLKDLEDLCRGDLAKNERQRRRLARQFLRRVNSPLLTESQREFVKRLKLEPLTEQMKSWAHEPVDHEQLLSRLERFELRNDGTSARLLGQMVETVRWNATDVKNLNEALNVHYRNSNLRVAISGHLMNRLLPDPKVEQKEAFDEILGAEVFSQSRILNRLKLILLPDRRRWRLGLEATGEVDSESSSTKGPATFYNEGVSSYRARKIVLVDRRGIRLARARAQASSNSTLTDVETDFDSIPLLNLLARGIAINQHDSSVGNAQFEVEQRVATMASSRLDREVESHVAKATNEFRRKVILPLHRLELNPQTTDMQTTNQRIIARYRLAGIHQLGANTPRPLAPGNSWLSIQMHESALNNVFEQLKLGGKEMTVLQLYERIAKSFARTYQPRHDVPADIRIRFAQHNGVRVTCDHGRVTLNLKFAELIYGRQRIRNFGIRAFFKPVTRGLRAQLVRTQHIEISGRLRIGQKLTLRPIFAKALPVSRALDLIEPKLSSNAKLRDLSVSQFEIAHGWIGIALAKGRGIRVSLKD